jgi:hypothetical protein
VRSRPRHRAHARQPRRRRHRRLPARSGRVVNQQAARRLRHGGAIVNVSSSDPIAPDLADELRARDITVNGLTPGLEAPGADHDTTELVALLDHWRHSPGE